jgi:hypothetical protein
MEPKFQSSFIPKGPIADSSNVVPSQSKPKGLFGLLAKAVFAIAVVFGLGIFGYNQYLSYSISQIGAELDTAREQLGSGNVRELINLDARINATNSLLQSHVVLTPLLNFMEESTLRTVRFIEFDYGASDSSLEIRLKGLALGYSAVALQTKAFTNSQYFKNVRVSDLRLDDKGNVAFSLVAEVDPTLISYKRKIDQAAIFYAPEPVIEDNIIEDLSIGDDLDNDV